MTSLQQAADSLQLSPQFAEFTADGRFQLWSGSDNPNKHHYGKGGLAQHTTEVFNIGLATADTLSLELNQTEWFLACLFHDAGKMLDYEPVAGSQYTQWQPTEHKRLIHHISRSAVIWSKFATKHHQVLAAYEDSVLHAILAHHGQREWGSPVAPKSRLAWLLHLCDNLSARMNDCDKLDYLKHRS